MGSDLGLVYNFCVILQTFARDDAWIELDGREVAGVDPIGVQAVCALGVRELVAEAACRLG